LFLSRNFAFSGKYSNKLDWSQEYGESLNIPFWGISLLLLFLLCEPIIHLLLVCDEKSIARSIMYTFQRCFVQSVTVSKRKETFASVSLFSCEECCTQKIDLRLCSWNTILASKTLWRVKPKFGPFILTHVALQWLICWIVNPARQLDSCRVGCGCPAITYTSKTYQTCTLGKTGKPIT
jgi:hypothetical protein